MKIVADVTNVMTYKCAMRISRKQNITCIIYYFAFNCLLISMICGCAVQQDLLAEKDEYIANLRFVVLDRVEILSEQEKIFIMQSDPKVQQYKIAGTFGQYGWIWNVPTGRSIIVSYTGDLTTFDTDKIMIQLDEANK